MQGVFGLVWGWTASGALAIGIGGVLGSEGRVVAIGKCAWFSFTTCAGFFL